VAHGAVNREDNCKREFQLTVVNVIPVSVYNALSYTVECIGAVIRSRPKTRHEMVIADDAATDGSAHHLKTIRNIKLPVQPSNVGFLANTSGPKS
jgi:hypothetical protein